MNISQNNRERVIAAIISALAVALALFAVVGQGSVSRQSIRSSFRNAPRLNQSICDKSCHASAVAYSDAMLRRAQRLHDRLTHAGDYTPPLASLARALQERKELLERSMTVSVLDRDNTKTPQTWELTLAQHPDILHFEASWNDVRFVPSSLSIERLLEHGGFAGSDTVMAPTLSFANSNTKHARLEESAAATAGYAYGKDAASDIADAIESGKTHIVVMADYSDAYIRVKDETGVHELTLLSSGRSNFEKSPDNREANIHKALSDHIHNTVVRPGQKFSFNATLDGPVTLDKGWKEALGLFGGGAAMTPGGGICQAATTVYRAALFAGLPIIERKSHSLYVSYYEKYGVGIDATIFPGIQDLVFLNDTDEYIVIQAYAEGQDAIVNIFGSDDKREVVLEGPYFSSTKGRPKSLYALGTKDIGWLQTVRYSDDSTRVVPLISRYAKSIPWSLHKTYTAGAISNVPVPPENNLTLHSTTSL